MTPQQMRDAGVSLWGRRIWHVKLAEKARLKPHHIAAMHDGAAPIPDHVREILIDGLRKRTQACVGILVDLGVAL